MKIRNGFVTNSSSSSFVICFKDEEKDREKLLKDIEENEDMSYYNSRTAQEIYDIVMLYVQNEIDNGNDGISNRQSFLENIEEELDCNIRWSDYFDEDKKSDKEKNKELQEAMNEFKKEIEGATTLATIELDDHEDGSSEYVMRNLVGNGIVLRQFSHH